MRMTDRQSVLANAVVPNVLSGKTNEFMPFNGIVRYYGCSSAAGINATLLIGGSAIVQDQEISAANRFPIVPDDFVVQSVAPAGARLVLSLRNTTAGPLTAWSAIDIEPL